MLCFKTLDLFLFLVSGASDLGDAKEGSLEAQHGVFFIVKSLDLSRFFKSEMKLVQD